MQVVRPYRLERRAPYGASMRRIIAVLAVPALLLAACSSDDSDEPVEDEVEQEVNEELEQREEVEDQVEQEVVDEVVD